LTLSTLWLSDPVFTGDYPPLLRKLVGDRLPTFTAEESALLKGSSDFLGLNHYTTFYVRKRVTPIKAGDWQNHFFGENESTTTAPDGTEIGPKAGLSWVRPVPWGFGKLLRFLWRRYDRDVWVTEVSFPSLRCANMIRHSNV
jgi:beta-glucosidase